MLFFAGLNMALLHGGVCIRYFFPKLANKSANALPNFGAGGPDFCGGAAGRELRSKLRSPPRSLPDGRGPERSAGRLGRASERGAGR